MVEELNIKLNDYAKHYSGKHNGWAYQLLNDNYESINLGVCCKDFLQDIIWSELTQKEMTIYGQTSKYQGVIDKQQKLKLLIYPYYFRGIYNPVVPNLEELSINLQAFLNEIEILRNYELSDVIYTDNKLLIEFSKEWIQKPWIFSLFTLLCRLGIYYDGNLEDYLKNPSKAENTYLDTCDAFYVRNYYDSLLKLLKNEVEIQQVDWVELINAGDVHNSGVFTNINKIIKNDK